MARNRQQSKQRQAERRARRLAEQGGRGDGERLIDDPTTVDPSPAVSPDLAAGAPPTNEGRSDELVEDHYVDEADLGDEELTEEEIAEERAYEAVEDWEVGDAEEAIAAGGVGEAGYEARGRRGDSAEAARKRPRGKQVPPAALAEAHPGQKPQPPAP